MYFFYVWQIDSTQNHSKALQNLHSMNVTFWTQSANQILGRGQRGKKWDSFEGNLFITGSFGLPEIAFLGRLSIVVGVKLAEILDSFLPYQIGLKWPNDILCDRKKVGGILIELEDNRVLVGIGINIVQHPENTNMPATHLWAYCNVKINALVHEIINKVDFYCLENFETIQNAWWQFAKNTIAFWRVSKMIEGEIIGIDNEGQLLIRSQDAKISKRHQTFD